MQMAVRDARVRSAVCCLWAQRPQAPEAEARARAHYDLRVTAETRVVDGQRRASAVPLSLSAEVPSRILPYMHLCME